MCIIKSYFKCWNVFWKAYLTFRKSRRLAKQKYVRVNGAMTEELLWWQTIMTVSDEEMNNWNVLPLSSYFPALAWLMGPARPRTSVPGGRPLSGEPGLCQRSTLHAQPRAPREPVPVPLPQPRLLHGRCPQQPAVHPAFTGGRPLPPANKQQHLLRLLLLPLPPIHQQPCQRPGVQDGDGGSRRRPQQPPRKQWSPLIMG